MKASDVTSRFICFLALCRVVEKKQRPDKGLESSEFLT
jgi:hypothetical protein